MSLYQVVHVCVHACMYDLTMDQTLYIEIILLYNACAIIHVAGVVIEGFALLQK